MEEQMQQAVRLVVAMMGSASTEKIRPVDWWVRARTALETGAASADSFSEMISVMGMKLQIEAANNRTAQVLSDLSSELDSADAFDVFRRLCERQALYVVAMAQAEREKTRGARK